MPTRDSRKGMFGSWLWSHGGANATRPNARLLYKSVSFCALEDTFVSNSLAWGAAVYY